MTKLTLFVAAFALCATSRAATGAAKVSGTSADSKVAGTVKFEDTAKGLRVSAELSGLAKGDHGFHIHQFGLCDDAGKAAGSHYNPENRPHGSIMHDGHKKAHQGDMGNITAKDDGTAVVEVVIPTASLTGKNAVAGRAVIVHEKADDFTQPAGNAGGRVGCGTIVVTGE